MKAATLLETLVVLLITIVLSAIVIEAAFRVYEAFYLMKINAEFKEGVIRQQ